MLGIWFRTYEGNLSMEPASVESEGLPAILVAAFWGVPD